VDFSYIGRFGFCLGSVPALSRPVAGVETLERAKWRLHNLMPSLIPVFLSGISFLYLCSNPMLLVAAKTGSSDQRSEDHACADMHAMHSMSVMGSSMTAMAQHMCVTPLRPKAPGDEERARVIVTKVKAAIEKYKDYKRAVEDGYVIANPKVDQPQFHFNNPENVREADFRFNPAKPSSLLYRRTPTQKYKLEGVMFTDSTSAGEDELNDRIPLSIGRWHEHTNFCAAPASKVSEYHGGHPKFGMFGSIHTADACKADGGTFLPVVFSWMIHVFPYEGSLEEQFSMNDDVPHVH
jgi:hypothetical protein